MPSLAPLLKIVCDGFDRAIYSDHLTVPTLEHRQSQELETSSSHRTSMSSTHFDRLPWFIIVKRLDQIHIKENNGIAERISQLQQKLHARERDITVLHKRVIAIKQEVHGKEEEMTRMKEQVVNSVVLVEQQKQDKEEAVRRVIVELDNSQREQKTLELALQQANNTIESLSVYKATSSSDDNKILTMSTVTERQRYILVDPKALTEQSIREAGMLLRQFYEIMNGKVDDLETSLIQHRTKTEIINTLRQSEINLVTPVADAEIPETTELAPLVQADVELYTLMSEFEHIISKIYQEQKQLSEHITTLKTTLAKQKDYQGYVEWRKYALDLQHKYSVQMYISYDNGKSYKPFKDATYCVHCGERILLCPHLNRYDITVPLLSNIQCMSDDVTEPNTRRMPSRFVTHLQFRRPTLSINIPEKHYLMDNMKLATVTTEEEAIEEYVESKIDHGSRYFRLIWHNYFNKRRALRPAMPRAFELEKLLQFINELYGQRWIYENENSKHHQRFLDYFHDYLTKRYQIPSIASRVAYELLASFEFHQESNSIIHLFVRHLAGSDDCVWKYLRLARNLFERFEPMDLSHYRQLIRILYPFRSDALYEQIELEQISSGNGKLTTNNLEDQLRTMVRKRTEANFRGFRILIEKFDHVRRPSLTSEQWMENVAVILPTIPRELSLQHYAIAEHDYGKNRVSIERLAQIISYLYLHLMNELNWGLIMIDRKKRIPRPHGTDYRPSVSIDKSFTSPLLHLKTELSISGYRLEPESESLDFRRIKTAFDMEKEEIERLRKTSEVERLKEQIHVAPAYQDSDNQKNDELDPAINL